MTGETGERTNCRTRSVHLSRSLVRLPVPVMDGCEATEALRRWAVTQSSGGVVDSALRVASPLQHVPSEAAAACSRPTTAAGTAAAAAATTTMAAVAAGRPPNPLPYIIAMTAAAMEADKTRCFEAGMDDFVSKAKDALKATGTEGNVERASRVSDSLVVSCVSALLRAHNCPLTCMHSR